MMNASSRGGETMLGSSGGALLGALGGASSALGGAASALGGASSALGGASSALKQINPLKTLGSGILSLVKNLGSAFKPRNIIRLVLALLIALFWAAPTMFPFIADNYGLNQLVSWLTFAQGGAQGGVSGVLGGLFGKGLTAATVISLVTSPKKTLMSVGGGFGKVFKAFNFKQPGSIGPMLLGVGVALVGYNFMVGSASLAGAMAAVSALVMTLRSLNNRSGFMKNLLGGFFAKNKKVDKQAINTCMAGMATGFALSALLSAMPWAYAPYVIGVILLVVGLVLAIVLRSNKEVVAA